MMDMENVKQFLSNLRENYLADIKQSVSNEYKAKCLGSMEALLVVLGVINAGVPLEYKSFVIVDFKLFGVIPIKWTTKEKYPDLILRLAAETLNKT